MLWGSAGHVKVLADIIALRGGKVLALFDNRQVPSALPGVPIFIGEVGFDQWAKSAARVQHVAGLAAIGGNRGRDRLYFQDFFKKHELTLPVLVHPSAVVSRSALEKAISKAVPKGKEKLNLKAFSLGFEHVTNT